MGVLLWDNIDLRVDNWDFATFESFVRGVVVFVLKLVNVLIRSSCVLVHFIFEVVGRSEVEVVLGFFEKIVGREFHIFNLLQKCSRRHPIVYVYLVLIQRLEFLFLIGLNLLGKNVGCARNLVVGLVLGSFGRFLVVIEFAGVVGIGR